MENQNGQSSVIFEWHSLVRDLLKNFWVIVLAGIMGWMGTYIAARSFLSPVYTSSATLAVRYKMSVSDDYAALGSATQMAKIFTEVFQQPAMKEKAAAYMGQQKFDGTITAQEQGLTNLVQVSVTADNPEKAYRQLNAVLAVYPEISNVVFANSVIDVLDTPTMPEAPSNTMSMGRKIRIMGTAMILAAAALTVASLLRDTVKNEKAFEQKIDGKLLGAVSHEKSHLRTREKMGRRKRALLINDSFAGLKFSEDLQKIATKLERIQKTTGSKVFAVTSVAENEGKSTTAVNLAMALAERGYWVALLDMDMHKPALYKMIGQRQNVAVEFADVLSGKVAPSQLKLYRYRKSSLVVAFNKNAHTDTTHWLTGPVASTCLNVMRGKMDFVIVDTPPLSVSADAVNLSAMVDETILVVRTDRVLTEDINDHILTLRSAGGKLAGCVLNDVYKPFSLFGQMGSDESGKESYHHRRGAAAYSKYSRLMSDEICNVQLQNAPFDAGQEDRGSSK